MRVLFPLLLLAVWLPGSATAAIIRVPADHPTIQAAIDAAVTGDEVLVAPGTYTGPGNKNLRIELKDIAVRSEGGPEMTIIDCEGSGRGFTIAGVYPPLGIVEGFTVQNGDGDGGDLTGGGALFIAGGSPTIRSCVFRYNTGGGPPNSPQVGGGGGAVCYGSFSLFEDCTFEANAAPYGGALALHGSGLVIRDCRFVGNTAAWDGGGITTEYDVNLPKTWIEGCDFIENLARDGGGATLTRCRVEDCSFVRNIARAGSGAGLSAYASSVVGCRFEENTSQGRGGGVVIHRTQLIGCTISGNRAEQGGGVGIGGESTVENCTITDNVAEELGGGLHSSARGETVIKLCTFARNSAPLGSGLAFEFATANIIETSIVAFGLGAAIECIGSPMSLSCTDIYGNEGGDWVGCIAEFASINGNLEADPRFCDPEADNWLLCEDSPCAPGETGDCGLIGAFGVGCSCPNAVEPATWGRIKAQGRNGAPNP